MTSKDLRDKEYLGFREGFRCILGRQGKPQEGWSAVGNGGEEKGRVGESRSHRSTKDPPQHRVPPPASTTQLEQVRGHKLYQEN